jgi:sialate O-acetylesterase
MNKLPLLIAFTLVAGSVAHADVTLPHILAEHMVVQRDLPVHIWGKAKPDEGVAVTFRGATQSATADSLGRWSVYLPPGAAGGPFDLTIRGNNTIAFHDILVGDVWVASGQSNMEFKLRQADNAQTEIANAKYPPIIPWKTRAFSPGPISILKTPAVHPLSRTSSRAICRRN